MAREAAAATGRPTTGAAAAVAAIGNPTIETAALAPAPETSTGAQTGKRKEAETSMRMPAPEIKNEVARVASGSYAGRGSYSFN